MKNTLKEVFPSLTDEELEILAGKLEERSCSLGEVLFEEGEARDRLYIVKEGEVDLVKRSEGAMEHVARFFENDIVGVEMLFDGEKHAASCLVATNTVLLSLKREDIDDILENNPAITAKIYKRVAALVCNRPKIPAFPKPRKGWDSLGELEIPGYAYYGVQTERARQNFRITGIPISHFPLFVKSLAMIKKAAALANKNRKIDPLDKDIADAIAKACDEIIDGAPYLRKQFVVDVIQGGAGTSANMNANEVIGNRAQEILGYGRGRVKIDGEEKLVVHPNDHVNKSQSTNDVYPTAIRLTILLSYQELTLAMTRLAHEFHEKAKSFSDIVKMGRTQLQDAVPMTLGQEFEAFSVTVREDIDRINEAAEFLKEINLGGTAIGTGITATSYYQDLVVEYLRHVTGINFKKAEHLVEATWDTGVFVLFSGILKRIAVKSSKICNDLRLLNSGPRAGFGDINLPPVQPGSSIMPGKVNPVIPEVVNQVAFQVIGNDLAVSMASEAGQLQLNAFEPIIAFNILQSLQMLTNALDTLADHVMGITANRQFCRQKVEESPGLATFLIPRIGYDKAVKIAKEALLPNRSVRSIVLEQKLMTEEEWEEFMSPENLTSPYKVLDRK